jgi:hypothetical protein
MSKAKAPLQRAAHNAPDRIHFAVIGATTFLFCEEVQLLNSNPDANISAA